MQLLRVVQLCFVLAAAGTAYPAESSPPVKEPLSTAQPFPSLVMFAASRDLPLAGFEVAEGEASPRPGDRVILLLQLSKRDTAPQQWLVLLELDELTAKERSLKLSEDVIHTVTGLELRYANSPAVLRVTFIGPFAGPTSAAPRRETDVTIKDSRAVVSREYLNLGIAEYCRVGLDVTARSTALGTKPIRYGGKGSPYSPETITKGKAAAASIHLTPAEERLAFSVFFSLRAFFEAAIKIEALQDVLAQVMVRPSAWSVATNLGLKSNFVYGWHQVRSIRDTQTGLNLPTYRLPLNVSLNGVPAFNAVIQVTDPRPPLEVSAGILAINVEHPTDATKHLSIQVLAARRPSAAKAR